RGESPYDRSCRSQGDRYNPAPKPSARQASVNSRTTSPAPPRHGLRRTVWPVTALGHRQKPSWCFAVSTIDRKPADRADRAHWRASSADGSNSDGLSSPVPHSRSVNVLTPKCRKRARSRRSYRSCAGVGRGRALPNGRPARSPAPAAAHTDKNVRRPHGSVRRVELPPRVFGIGSAGHGRDPSGVSISFGARVVGFLALMIRIEWITARRTARIARLLGAAYSTRGR